jgi:hypothetical protein
MKRTSFSTRTHTLSPQSSHHNTTTHTSQHVPFSAFARAQTTQRMADDTVMTDATPSSPAKPALTQEEQHEGWRTGFIFPPHSGCAIFQAERRPTLRAEHAGITPTDTTRQINAG